MNNATRKRIRHGIGISLEEYSSRNIDMVRALQSELIISGGYIGYFDAWEKTIRVFVFEKADDRNKALKTAHSIGFSSAGRVEGELFVRNSDLQRTHLRNYRTKDQFYKEYYR